jgi:hypothetical protein
MRRKTNLVEDLASRLQDNQFWLMHLVEKCKAGSEYQNVHIAIFREPFLQWIFDGTKAVESRFSKNELAPYRSVNSGDVILLKEVGGPIVGISRASQAWDYRLDPKTWDFIRGHFAELIGDVDESFWQDRQNARFATFISLDNVVRIDPLPYAKRDRRGWVIAVQERTQMKLDL